MNRTPDLSLREMVERVYGGSKQFPYKLYEYGLLDGSSLVAIAEFNRTGYTGVSPGGAIRHGLSGATGGFTDWLGITNSRKYQHPEYQQYREFGRTVRNEVAIQAAFGAVGVVGRVVRAGAMARGTHLLGSTQAAVAPSRAIASTSQDVFSMSSPVVNRKWVANKVIATSTPQTAMAVRNSVTNDAFAARSAEAYARAARTARVRHGDVTTLQDFVNRSRVGDQLEGHELWQHASLRVHGLATRRLSTAASRNNPTIALYQPIHSQVNLAQQMLDATRQTPIENINANAMILRLLNAAPEDAIGRAHAMALQHARRFGFR